MPRAPLEVWRADDPELAHRFVTGLARMFADADIRAIDERLTANIAAPKRTLRASCTVAEGDVKRAYDCIGDVVMKGDAAAIALLAVGDAEPVRHLTVTEAARKPGVFAFTPRSGKARCQVTVHSRDGELLTSAVLLSEPIRPNGSVRLAVPLAKASRGTPLDVTCS